MLERCAELLRQAGKTAADIFGDTGFGAATAQMAALGVPHALHADADALRASTVQLAEVAHELAVAELAGLKKEGKVTQRFRAPQTLAVLNAAAALLKDVDAWATPVARVDEEHAAELRRGIEEVGAMGFGGGGEAEEDDELDPRVAMCTAAAGCLGDDELDDAARRGGGGRGGRGGALGEFGGVTCSLCNLTLRVVRAAVQIAFAVRARAIGRALWMAIVARGDRRRRSE